MTEAIWSIIWAGGLLIVSQLSPGPDFFLVVRTALSQGFRSATALSFGITLGLLIQAIVVCLVGTWVVEQSWSCLVMAAAGVWLLYLSYNIMPWDRLPRRVMEWVPLKAGQSAALPAEPMHGTDPMHAKAVEQALETPHESHSTKQQLVVQGFLCNILNPKCMLFISGICIGPLNAYGTASNWFMPALAIALGASSQAGWMLWSGLLQFRPLRRSYCRRAHIIDAVFATLLALCALLLFVPLLQTVGQSIF